MNKSSLPHQKPIGGKHSGKQKEARELRFRFDALDTLRYWYERVGDVFGLGSNSIAEIAEKWVCVTNGDFPMKIPSTITIKSRKSMVMKLCSNDHGTDPVVEARRSYAEWHSMFCAAGELLGTHPIMEDKWEGGGNAFEYWLTQWTCTWPDFWIADMRDPAPLEKPFWHLEGPIGEDWEEKISPDAFDSFVSITERSESEFFFLDGDYRRANRDGSETINIDSALVIPETAPALLRALQTTEDPYRYCVPLEGGDLEIDAEGFELKGWLRHQDPVRSGLDMNDPLRNSLSGSIILPGMDFMAWGDLISSSDLKRFYRKGKELEAVTIFENWNDLRTTERHHQGFYSEGSRLHVRKTSLLAYLKDRQRYLIVKCTIHRWVDRKGEGKYVPGKAKIYLIRHDGKIETL